MKLAEQVRQELTERANNAEICKKYFLDWVVNQFREGHNPVKLRCSNCIENIHWESEKDRKELVNTIGALPESYAKLEYGSGCMFIKHNGIKYDITNTAIAQKYVPNGLCESDKTMFLTSEGFKCYKHWVYGEGYVINVTF